MNKDQSCNNSYYEHQADWGWAAVWWSAKSNHISYWGSCEAADRNTRPQKMYFYLTVHVFMCFLVSLLTLVVFVCFKHIEATRADLTSPGNINSHLPELMSQFQIIFFSTDCVSSSQLFASLHMTSFKKDGLCLETLKVERCFFFPVF